MKPAVAFKTCTREGKKKWSIIFFKAGHELDEEKRPEDEVRIPQNSEKKLAREKLDSFSRFYE